METQAAIDEAEALKKEGNELHLKEEYLAAAEKYQLAKDKLAPKLSHHKAKALNRSCSLNQVRFIAGTRALCAAT